MKFRKTLCACACCLAFFSALYAVQQPFRQYPGVEYRRFELPPDWEEKTEWAFARLMFPPGPNDGYRGRYDGDWRLGLSLWTQDYPRADRHFSQALRRLTRIHTRSVEQPVSLEDGIVVRDIDDGAVRKNPGHAAREYLPLFGPVEIVGHKEAAAKQIFAQHLGLRICQAPFAYLNGI